MVEETVEDESLEMLKAVESEKKETALYDIEQIRLNSENVLRVLQVQLTKVLMDISDIEKQLEYEVNQYWMRELPIRNSIQNYLNNVSLLVNIYTQQEQLLTRTFQEIMEGIDFPDYAKLEEAYNERISELMEQMELMKQEVEKVKLDLEEDFDDVVKEAVAKEKVKVHRQYEEVMSEAEIQIEILEEELEKWRASGRKLPKKILPLKVDEKHKLSKSPDDSDAVYTSPTEEKSKKEKKVGGFEDIGNTVKSDILKLMGEKKDYKTIQGRLSRKYSVSTFYKYMNEMVDDEVLERTKDALILKVPKKRPKGDKEDDKSKK